MIIKCKTFIALISLFLLNLLYFCEIISFIFLEDGPVSAANPPWL